MSALMRYPLIEVLLYVHYNEVSANRDLVACPL